MKRLLALALVAPLAACSATPTASPTPTTLTARGFIDVSRVLMSSKQGDSCVSDRGHEDVAAGAQVKVLDPAGKVVSFGTLNPGTAMDKFPEVTGSESCRFTFSVSGVPAGLSIYGVEVANRGVVQFQEGQLGEVALTLR